MSGAGGTKPLDVVVVGGGIVGLAVARRLQETAPSRSVLVLEKEPEIAPAPDRKEQRGHPFRDLLRARFAPGPQLPPRGGAAAPFLPRTRGSLRPVGQGDRRRERGRTGRLDELQRRGEANGVPGLRLLDREALREIEPTPRGSRRSTPRPPGWSVSVRWRRRSAVSSETAGGRVETGARVLGFARSDGAIRILTTKGDFACRRLVTCAGLHADRMARLAGDEPELQVVPFRGEYYRVRPERAGLVRGLIYPTPDPRFPFLGVHFHRNLDQQVDAGPNAVLALAREGYRRRDLDLGDLRQLAGYSGFRRLALREWRVGVDEIHALSRSGPSPGGCSGWCRKSARTISPPRPPGCGRSPCSPTAASRTTSASCAARTRIHVLNAPSPAATASLAIAEQVAALADE